MARYPSSSRSAARRRSWIYIFAAVAIVVVVVAFIYGPQSSTGGQQGDQQDANALADNRTTPGEVNIANLVPPTIPSPRPAVESQGRVEPEPVEPEPEPLDIIETQIPEPTEPVAADPDASRQVASMIVQAVNLVNSSPGNTIKARDILSSAMKLDMTPRQRAYLRTQLSKLSEEWLFSRSMLPDDKLCTTYRVKSGENLSTIADRYKVPYEALMRINNIARPQDLQAGATIKVVNGPFNAKVYRSDFTLDLYLQDTFVKSFKVGLGRPGHETPTGTWIVKNRLIKPPWTDPDTHRRYLPSDPDYPLGSRWIGIDGIAGSAKGREGFAIHGTNKPEEIGTNGSRGCIRLHNGNAVFVYDFLKERISKVWVFD